MIFYIAFLILILGHILQESSSQNNKKLIFIFCSTVLAALAGLRGDVGQDDETYKVMFSEVNSIESGVQEPLFNLSVLFLKWLGLESQSLFILFAVFSAVILYIIIEKTAPYLSVLILVVYFSHKFIHNDLNLIRQGLGSLIFIYSVTVYEKKKALFFLLNLIGASIHLPAILACGGFFCCEIVISKVMNLRGLIRLIVLSSFLLICVILGVEFDLNVVDFSMFGFTEKYSTYQVRDDFNASFNPVFDIVFIKMVLIVVCFSWFSMKRQIDFKIMLMLHSMIFGLAVLIVFQSNTSVAKRISSYFFTSEPFVVCWIVNELKAKWSFLSKVAVIALSAIQLVYNVTWLKVVGSYNICF